MLYTVIYKSGFSIDVFATDLDEAYSAAFDETGISGTEINHVEPA
jgi:hypothetical protein